MPVDNVSAVIAAVGTLRFFLLVLGILHNRVIEIVAVYVAKILIKVLFFIFGLSFFLYLCTPND